MVYEKYIITIEEKGGTGIVEQWLSLHLEHSHSISKNPNHSCDWLSANAPGKATDNSSSTESLAPTGEIWIEFQAPGFNLTQPQGQVGYGKSEPQWMQDTSLTSMLAHAHLHFLAHSNKWFVLFYFKRKEFRNSGKPKNSI